MESDVFVTHSHSSYLLYNREEPTKQLQQDDIGLHDDDDDDYDST